MSKFDEKILFYKKNMTSMGLAYEDELFEKITRGLGPSIFKRDAASVSTSDEKEVFTVKHNFLINKLGLEDGKICANLSIARVNRHLQYFLN